jgi:hypothetical protein
LAFRQTRPGALFLQNGCDPGAPLGFRGMRAEVIAEAFALAAQCRQAIQ